MKKPGKASLRKAIKETGGVISDLAAHYSCSRQTIYNWLEHYELRGEIEKSRHSLRAVATDVIYQRLLSNNEDKSWEAAKFVTLHLQDSGDLLALSPETMSALSRMGIRTSDVVAEFEAMVQQHAESSA